MKAMSKRFAILITIPILLHLVFAPCAFAREVIYSPQDMIESSSLIVDATVVDDPTRYVNKVDSLEVNAVLKGTTTSPTITVSKSFYQEMPSPGTRVMVLLQNDLSKYELANYVFTGDVNNIGIIKDGKVVDIYQGINLKTAPYVAVYNNFYQEKTKERQAKLQRIEKHKQEIAKERELARQRQMLIAGTAVVFVGVLLGVLWLYRIRKARAA